MGQTQLEQTLTDANPVSIPFPFLDAADLSVTVDGVIQIYSRDYTVDASSTLTWIFPPLTFPATLEVQRITPIEPEVDWTLSSAVTQDGLDVTAKQPLYKIEELINAGGGGAGDVPAGLVAQVDVNTAGVAANAASSSDNATEISSVGQDVDTLRTDATNGIAANVVAINTVSSEVDTIDVKVDGAIAKNTSQDSVIAGISGQASSNQARLNTVEPIVSSNTGRITELEANSGDGTGSSTLAGLTDTDLGAVSAGQVLTFDSELLAWTNANPTGGDIADDVQSNTDAIGALTGATQINAQGIIDNGLLISTNTSAVSDMQGDVSANTGSIANHEGRIAINEGAIGTLQQSDTDNSAAISTLTGDVDQNTAQIGVNSTRLDNQQDSITTVSQAGNVNTQDIITINNTLDGYPSVLADGNAITRIRIAVLKDDPQTTNMTFPGAGQYCLINTDMLSGRTGNGQAFKKSETAPLGIGGGDDFPIGPNQVRTSEDLVWTVGRSGYYRISSSLEFMDLPTMSSTLDLEFYYNDATLINQTNMGNIHPMQFGTSVALFNNFASNQTGDGTNRSKIQYEYFESGNIINCYAAFNAMGALANGQPPVIASDASFIVDITIERLR